MSSVREVSSRSIALAAAAVLAAGLSAACSTGTGVTPSTSPARTATLELQSEYVRLVQDVGPSVVLIQTDSGLGSGIIYDAHGNIVTNNHVVGNARTFQVVTSSGKQYVASLAGTFPPDDLAVIRVSADGLRPATFADSSRVQVGDIAMAIGNPLGLQSSVTEGIVSAMRTGIPEGNGVTLPAAIQTSAAINPGNSGGALVNLNEQVIGIPTLGMADPQLGGGAAPGIGFAIPSNTVTSIAGQLIKSGHVTNSGRAYLGVDVANTGGNGVFVSTVQSSGPADRAGIKPGDIITAVGGKSVTGRQSLADALVTFTPGQQAKVAVVRSNGSTGTVTVTLGEYQ